MDVLFIAGTDTDAGKTVLTSALAAYWLKHFPEQSLGIMKPLQSGTGDREHYTQLFSLNQTAAELNPIHFEAPLAPPLAADLAGADVRLDLAWQTFEKLRQRSQLLLVEGLGGLGSPVTHELTVADLAWDWHLPTVLVVPVKLGAIGQAIANVAMARQAKVHLKGIVLSCATPCTAEQIEQWANADMIESFTSIPVLGLLPYLDDLNDREALSQAAAALDLEQFFPLPFKQVA
ncbi:ATP-dependent dethiobiotin synthetase BioD [filamentous cyanobacterium LEGE 11480]|uniref:ATP-dependent dethiobiotin synthetase BioD n=1 Tax=Romeriopsis navalis LEGE 11480 TaxID=2777977 RepID=A0A928VKM8_9CYAN|nr:dethiobiotin synthase [Romeriopsis navalis]MBE9029483.1 ATP-dependent dethiobiotin synthetase BioD [Romeriopsis navalis LEGE 11480]